MLKSMSYLGSKAASGARQAIVAQMPPHDTYIETHLGTGAVLRAKPPAARSIGIEIDPQTIADHPAPDGVQVVQGDCVEFLKSFDFSTAGRCLVYLDPPYLMSTRSSDKRYRFDWTEADHVALLDLVKSLPDGVLVMISGYPSDLYDRALVGWRKIRFQVMTRGGPRTECLWMNFDQEAVAWSTYAGSDFTDRQRIKRKAERWRRNYAKLPPGERLAVLAAILGEEASEDPFRPE